MNLTNELPPISKEKEDYIVTWLLYIFTGIGYILLAIILYFMIKSKEKTNCYTFFKYQTFPMSIIYIFTKLPIYASKSIVCQNFAVLRNFFFILLVSVQALSIVYTFLTVYSRNLITNHIYGVTISLFCISWIPPLVGLVIGYITLDDCNIREVGNLCIYDTGLFVILRTVLYGVYFLMYMIFLFLIRRTVKKHVLEESGDIRGYQAYKDKMQKFYIIFIMLILTVTTVLLSVVFGDTEGVSFIENIITKFYEGFLPIIICFYNCLDEKHIAYIFNVFGCGKKKETVKSELEDQKQDKILKSEDNEDTLIE